MRSLVLVVLALVVVGAAPASRTTSGCFDAAIVSLNKNGATLERFHARERGLIRGYARTGPLLPGEDAVADGHGGWYVAGVGLAHLRGSGTLDPHWSSPLRRRLQLWTLARAGDRLFVSDGRRVFGIDAASGRVAWTSAPAGGERGWSILTLAATRDAVYVGGSFSRIGGVPRHQLAALRPADGHLLPWRTATLAPYGTGGVPSVTAVAPDVGRLYFIGLFRAVGGVPRPRAAAAVRLDNGGLTGFRPREPLDPLSLAVTGANVIIGSQETGGGVYDSRTGKRDPKSGLVAGAAAIATRGPIAYVGGNFRSSVGGHNLAAVNLETDGLRPWFPNPARFSGLATIALSGDKAFLGGQFCSAL
jgi:outer membrane protein assembly factor BamB